MNSKYTIRKGTEDDFSEVLTMIKELAVFEKALDKVTNSVEQMQAEKEFFEFFVVEYKGKIVAMALFYFAYYTWVGKSLYLDDLYVKEPHRGHGIGQELLKRIFNVAKENNCSRVRWQVLDWNEPAIQLYNKLGANLDSEWINCDFDKQGIYNIATV